MLRLLQALDIARSPVVVSFRNACIDTI